VKDEKSFEKMSENRVEWTVLCKKKKNYLPFVFKQALTVEY